ncbi:leucine-rich repeats and immunoglobulin-like domains protein 2 [Lytechinus pictus]|uniref:leucine-rich repeats and immunoglobulin-like domains protein 2 n=1 Tax=Lytechinus pictus TaxID=7653 RepID=UPI0030B9C149
MAPKEKILIWGIFIAGLVLNGNGESPDIHDGTVHTEREKTLIRGSLGILTCRFSGSPYAVFWKKGHDIWTSPTLIQWTPEDKITGPRYDDGSCDMDENYSLIIKSVNHTDRGRFICLVSNEDGILVDDYTDVTVSDDALEMESSVTLPLKQTGRVPCQVNIRPRKVSWFGSRNEMLVFIDLSKDSIVIGGTGYKDGLFHITGEYSLVIYNVKIQQEGLYFCVVTDYDTGVTYQDDSLLTVIGTFLSRSFAFPYATKVL